MLEIFSYTDADLSLDEVTEAQLIAVAQGHAATVGPASPEAAKSRLIDAYGPALRAAVRTFSYGMEGGGNSQMDTEDVQSAALVGFLALIADHDLSKSPRLAGRVAPYLARYLSEEFGAVAAFTVPTRTLSRFYGILKAADGDATVAEATADEYGMSRETFRDVHAAVRGTGSLDAETDDDRADRDPLATPVFTPSPVVDVEDKILVDMAFAAMDDEEARICELYYGFTEYEPVPDAEIAHRVGVSRPAIQRRRFKALAKARKSLGVALDEAA